MFTSFPVSAWQHCLIWDNTTLPTFAHTVHSVHSVLQGVLTEVCDFRHSQKSDEHGWFIIHSQITQMTASFLSQTTTTTRKCPPLNHLMSTRHRTEPLCDTEAPVPPHGDQLSESVNCACTDTSRKKMKVLTRELEFRTCWFSGVEL